VVLAQALLDAVSAIRRSGRRAARPVELAPLTSAQLELVRFVRRHPGVSVAQAATALRLAANTVSTLVGQLTEAGLLLRQADPTDRRIARLDLAPDIRHKVDAWRDRRATAVADALRRLPEDDVRRIAAATPALERLAAALDADPGGWR